MNWFAEYKKSLKMPEVEDLFDLFIYRPLAFLFIKIIYSTRITPNHLTFTALLLGIISGIMYAIGLPNGFKLGALFFVLYNIFDCSDGQLSRMKKNGTPAGRILDGIGDYIATLAVFIGIGIGFANHQDSPAFWWFLILLLIVSSVIQAVFVDFYRNRFLDYILQRVNTLEKDHESYKEEYNEIKNQKNKWFERTTIKIYLQYVAFQDKLTTKPKQKIIFATTPEEYYQKNKIPMRLWTLISSSAEITILIICSILNRLDLFFYIVLIGFNVFTIIVWLIQKNIDKSVKTTIA